MYLTLEEITVAWKTGAISGEQFLVLKHELTAQAANATQAEVSLAQAAPLGKLSAVSKTMLALGAAGMAAGSLAIAEVRHHDHVDEPRDVVAMGAAAGAPASAFRIGLTHQLDGQPVAAGELPPAHIHLGRADFAAQRQQKAALESGQDGAH